VVDDDDDLNWIVVQTQHSYGVTKRKINRGVRSQSKRLDDECSGFSLLDRSDVIRSLFTRYLEEADNIRAWKEAAGFLFRPLSAGLWRQQKVFQINAKQSNG